MPSLNEIFLTRKLASLHQYLGELETLGNMELKTYEADFVKRHATEKLIELIVEIASDINRHIITAAGREPASTYFSTFEEMGEIGIIPKPLVPKLASTTGLGNRLVHDYEKTDHKIVYQALNPFLRNYKQYYILISNYLNKL
ncbi:MAG: hypothetical protein Fur0022_48750 [Anaerolineales bacterium]